MSQVPTVADWAPSAGVSLFTRVYSALRSSYVMLVVDNPLSWTFGFRGQNAQDDIEGTCACCGMIETADPYMTS